MDEETILSVANEIANPFGLHAEIFDGIRSVGVTGDYRSYTSVINLIGPFPGYEALAKISSDICNRTPVNRVTFQITEGVSGKPD